MLREGQILGDTYRLLRRVGEGGMGVVYEATHARLAGRYAIKALTPELAENPAAVVHFDREARFTSLLQHPNVVQVIDHDTAPDGTEYIVMEYLAGESLSQRLSRLGRLPLDAVVGIVEQIAAGLSAAHAHGIVHRDLKPDNVVLVPVAGRRNELCKILDFGVSARRGSTDVPGVVCGTPRYMAPEQIEGRLADVDASTDQFALAVMAQEMLTGRNPFDGDSLEAIFVRISSAPPMSVGLGPRLDAVLARALAKSPRQRFPSVTAFAEAFRTAAGALAQNRAPLRSRAQGVEQRRAPRRPWAIALGAILALIVLVSASTMATTLRTFRHGSRLVSAGPVERPLTPPTPAVAPPEVEPLIEPPLVAATARTPPPSDRDVGASTPAPARQTRRSKPPPSRPPSRARVTLSPDEDATMPLSDEFDSPSPR